MQRVRGLSRGISRVIAVATAVWCFGLLARAVESSCVLAGHGVVDGDEAALTSGAAVITGVRDIARFAGDALSVPAVLAIAGLAAVSLGSLMVILRSRSDKAGATFAALAVYGALALSRTEIASILDHSGHSAWHLAARLGLAVGSIALAWRRIEDVALAASMAPDDDPHAVDARTDVEASRLARQGPANIDASSRRLRDALKSETTVMGADSGLSGRGSPIPRVLPDQDAPVGSGS